MTQRSGQTLIEVMVALFVLVTGFLGILTLLSQSIAISKETSDKTIATYLAEEGIELAKNAIDHDMYQRVSQWGGLNLWSQGGAYDPTFPNPGGGDYQLDYTFCNNVPFTSACPIKPFPYNWANPDLLKFDPETHLYSYAPPPGHSPVATPFSRDIKVQYGKLNGGPPETNELIVDSIVYWSTGAFTSQSVDLEDVFYNWHP